MLRTLLALCALAFATPAAAQPLTPAESAAIDALVARTLDKTQVPSASIAIVRGGRIVFTKAYGKASAAIPAARPDMPYQIASNSKQFAAMALLLLEDEGKLDLAAKFTNPGGEIRFGCDLHEDTVVISVQDNGCGIPPSQIAEVFERFYQAENNSNRRKRGLGLGLAICKNIVEAHGGRIWIDSEQGVGTTVYVELLLFSESSDLYTFDLQTGQATLPAPHLEEVSAER
jgi:K+-sensing histidine kinase KdpD